MLSHLLEDPVGIFLIVISVILIAPMISQLVRLPSIIGLILGGVTVGPYGVGLLERDNTIQLLATVGLIYLMFSAGAEIDLTLFAKVRNRSLFFGALTFLIPQVLGTLVGLALGYELLSSVLLGSIFASHTLISFPIITRLGIASNEAVAVTVGATIITDIAALLVLAAVVGVSNGNVTPFFFVQLLSLLLIYTASILWIVPRVGRLFFKYFRTGTIEFQFVLVVIFVAAFLAEVIGMEAIVGAFLAGLAINSTVPHHSAVMGRVLFIGESFFIPVFLISIGLLIDPGAFFTDSRTLLVSVVLTITVLSTKYIATRVTAWRFGYTFSETQVMWGLSMAQAAATLAATLIGVEMGLLDEATFNGVVTMILVTCVVSPLLIERYGFALTIGELEPRDEEELDEPPAPLFGRILIPVANPKTEDYLVELADILARANRGILLPLNIARLVHGKVEGLAHQHRLFEAERLNDAVDHIQPVRRIDASISNGILSASLEHDASSVIMGWSGESAFHKTIFGRMLDEVIWNSRVPVLVGRLTSSIQSKQTILLVIPTNSLTQELVKEAIDAASIIAQAIHIPLNILTTSQFMEDVSMQQAQSEFEFAVEQLDANNMVRHVTDKATPSDLVIITTFGSQRRFQSSLGSLPEEIASRTTASLIVMRFPY